MTKRSKKTLGQTVNGNRYLNSFYYQGALLDPGEIEKSYQDSARQLWQLDPDWETRLAIEIFGPDLMGSAAFALDPVARFKAGFRLIAPTTRSRRQEYKYLKQRIHWIADFKRYTTDAGDGTKIDEYLAFHEQDDAIYDQVVLDLTGNMHDSKQSQRKSYQHYGLMERHSASFEVKVFPVITYNEVIWEHKLSDGVYDRSENTYTLDFVTEKSPFMVPSWGWWGNVGWLDAVKEFTDSFARNHLQDVLPKVLANRRQFNLFYQLAELKDLPQLIKGTRDFLHFLQTTAKDPLKGVQHADKAASGGYLTWLFGYQSMLQAAEGLIKYPTKLAKKLNYLLEKNGTTAPVRTQLIFEEPNLQFYPVKDRIDSMLPVPYFDTSELEIYDASHITLSCSVTQRINFPKVGTPFATAKTLANSIGITPRVVDLYSLVPWTWLVDWFTGLTSYLNMVEAVNGDFQLINVGFVVVKVVSDFTIKGKLTVSDAVFHEYEDGSDTTVEYVNPRKIDIHQSFSGIFEKRYDIADLGDVKAMGLPGTLDDPQKSVVGALLQKFL